MTAPDEPALLFKDETMYSDLVVESKLSRTDLRPSA